MIYNTTKSGEVILLKYYNAHNVTVKFLNTGNIKHGVNLQSLTNGTVADRMAVFGPNNGYYTDYDIKVSNQTLYSKWVKLLKEHPVTEDWRHFDRFATTWGIARHDYHTTLWPNFYDFRIDTAGPSVSAIVSLQYGRILRALIDTVDTHALEIKMRGVVATPYTGYISDCKKVQSLSDRILRLESSCENTRHMLRMRMIRKALLDILTQ